MKKTPNSSLSENRDLAIQKLAELKSRKSISNTQFYLDKHTIVTLSGSITEDEFRKKYNDNKLQFLSKNFLSNSH